MTRTGLQTELDHDWHWSDADEMEGCPSVTDSDCLQKDDCGVFTGAWGESPGLPLARGSPSWRGLPR